MNEGALHIKYRPLIFDDFRGEANQDIIVSLKQQISKKWEDIPRAFLFTGPSGCGKTTLARILATELKCSQRDFNEFNAANTRGIDTIRDISSLCKMAPFQGKMRAYLLDECHSLTKDAFNALLKILEDTPKHVFFFLCTTEPSALLETIKNRCSVYNVSLWQMDEMYKFLKEIVEKENGTINIKVVRKISEESGGSPRRALTMLDQVLFIEDATQASNLVMNFSDSESQVIDICRVLVAKGGDKWGQIALLIKNGKFEPEAARYAILGYLRAILLNQTKRSDYSDNIVKMIDIFTPSIMYSKKAGLASALYYACMI